MPKVGKGDKAADFPYTKEGMEAAEDYAQQTNQEIDYSPGGTKNAPDMRESYHMGGQVPGQPGFGQKPGQQTAGFGSAVSQGLIKGGYMNPQGNVKRDDAIPDVTEFMKEGGKVKKY
tara:strand:+ start:60 stop:410 length:351 start_codon:yes stop_codon:yes gene_type:complete